MPVQITIIGLGQIGTSMGLALSSRKDLVTVVGHDKEPGVGQKAQKLGAVEKHHFNLPASVTDSDVVVLALPLSEIKDTFKYITQDLREDAVVFDTAPVKAPVVQWAGELLPASVHYVGLVPALNPATLNDLKGGQDAARADLFQKGLMGIITPQGTPGEAVKLASDFSRLLGAEPFYMDLVEADSLMAQVHLLPQLLSAAFLNATVDQPGWREARKLAGRAFAETTLPSLNQDTLAALLSATEHNKENVTRALDKMIAALQYLRADIAEGKQEHLETRLDRAVDGRLKWQFDRDKGDWRSVDEPLTKVPSAGDYFRKLFLGKIGEPPKKD
jgi:prephenate dehydrogenase